MKKTNLFITLVVVIVAATVAFVSCKKETENALNQQGNNTKRTIDIRQIEDINVYLKEFRQKMTESKGNEAMNLEDAAWHLTSLANIDLCQANVEFNDVRFDTIEMQIKANEHNILLSDLRVTYEQIVSEIQRFQENLSLDNKNLRFVNVFLTNKGIARIIMMTTTNDVSRNLDNNLWYFPDTFGYIDSICLYYFTAPQYQWNTTAKSNLERVMNVFEGRITPHVSAYISTRTVSFDFPTWKDSYGSPFGYNSRLCVGGTDDYFLYPDEMCYCLDSYLGLGCDYLADNYYVDNEYPIYWTIQNIDTIFPDDHLTTYYHRLIVQYGTPATHGPGVSPE